MSEFISMASHLNTDPERIHAIQNLVLDLLGEADASELKRRAEKQLGKITPGEFAYAAQLLIEDGAVLEDDKHEFLLRSILGDPQENDPGWRKQPPGHPLHTFGLENERIRSLISSMRRSLAVENYDLEFWSNALEQLKQTNFHYLRKEALLFPRLERKGFDYLPKAMRTLHERIRSLLQKLDQSLSVGDGEVFFNQLPAALDAIENMTHKEGSILFPAGLEMLDEEDWSEIRRDEQAIGYAFIDAPPAWPPNQGESTPTIATPSLETAPKRTGTAVVGHSGNVGAISLDGGSLTPEQINLVFKHLPLDVTFVDAYDEVKFYNKGQERVFPRSPGIIDREVRYCHPPKSVHIVERIVNAFKSSVRDVAEFWIQMRGRFIHIRYFAVRDFSGEYLGVLETTQDVTSIRTRGTGQKNVKEGV